MKIKKVIIRNFRAYREQKIIDIDDLTVFVGKNDVGKSTTLEALDIFFNNGKGVVKIEAEDLNKHAEKDGEKEISISVVFSDYPEQIDLDAGNKTSFKNEFLLNRDKNLEIKKIYKNARCSDIFLVAYHPTSELASELLLKKQKC
ncbi:MAG TPA: AAA family ATPase [Saprospiraceae bacterium]|nr:AAA family ATPase [Saprospiraceae bacterium]